MVEISNKNDADNIRDFVLDKMKEEIEILFSQNEKKLLNRKAFEKIPNWQSIIKDEIDRIKRNLLSAI